MSHYVFSVNELGLGISWAGHSMIHRPFPAQDSLVFITTISYSNSSNLSVKEAPEV